MWVNSLKKLIKEKEVRDEHKLNLAELEQSVCFRNINIDLTRKQKRVLICYIPDQFLRPCEELISHSNRFEACQIIRVFIEMDYIIDVVWPLSEFEPNHLTGYNIIFGFGQSYIRACKENVNAVKILYLTENNPAIAAEKFMERVNYYYERKKTRKTGIERNKFYSLAQFEISDYGILMNSSQNAESSRTYFKNSYLIKTTGIRHEGFTVCAEKEMSEACKHFLWLGSDGAIHKGLDILLDVFSEHENLTLHICGLSAGEKDFASDYQGKNIINHGFMKINSGEFVRDIVQKCAFIIMPSCSEGVSASVATGMLHGLIPVVTPECGIETDYDTGFLLESYKTEYVGEVLSRISSLSPKRLRTLQQNAWNYAQKEFTLEKFTRDFRNNMYKIVSHAELSKNKYCNAKL